VQIRRQTTNQLGEKKLEYLLYPTNLTISKPHLDAVRMGLAVGEYVLYCSICELPGALMLFQNNAYPDTGLDVATLFTVLAHDKPLEPSSGIYGIRKKG
jgi:hypothetical protein